jgi:predicted helicase
MTTIRIRPTDKPIRNYYAVRQELDAQGVKTEGNVRRAFGTLLAETAHQRNWTLVEELSEKSKRGTSIRPDGTLRDPNHLPYGYWEAKDTADDLDAEIRTKIGRGYPLSNIIFEDTRLAVLYQSKKEVFRADLSKPEDLAQLLTLFYSYNEPNFQGFEQAVIDFQQQIPDLGRRLAAIIKEAHQKNTAFQAAYDVFFNLCREALNPNLSREAVDEMLIQHLLTERLMRRVFNNPDFTRRNVIAAEVEKVIDALTSHSFSREEFFREVERFYIAIENAARSLTDFKDKQYFINGVYERFFQGYSVKVADTHGIVYTPHQIVDFMCAAVEEVLHDEFGLPLSHPDVVILDPCTGTGNFIINLMNRVPRHALGQFYREQLFANEVMLLPYYIAALNIEHAYYDLTGEYAPFEGLVFADTLDLVKHHNIPMFAPRNTQRMERERHAPITVIIGNPPYNVGQLNENDNNKNRRYEVVDARVRETYARDSAATNKNALSDVYVKFFRWATDRLGDSDGIVCFVSNNGFLNGIAFDGFRKHLQQDFDLIYHFDFKGNARTSGERRRQEGGNIFSNQIRVGVGINQLC